MVTGSEHGRVVVWMLVLAFLAAPLMSGCAGKRAVGSPDGLGGASPRAAGPRSAPRVESPASVDEEASRRSLARKPVLRHLAGVQVALYAGDGRRGSLDGPAGMAQLDEPISLALGSHGDLFVAERSSGRIRIVDTRGYVRTWVGEPSAREQWLGDSTSPFYQPSSLAAAPNDQLYLTDGHERVLSIDLRGWYSVLAGGSRGFRDGPGQEAAFSGLTDVALGPDGILYLADSLNNRIRVLTPEGSAATLAGTGEAGYRDGSARKAQFAHPNGLAVGSDGTVYVADGGSMNPYRDAANASIRTISRAGDVATLAGSVEAGYVDAQGPDARFGTPLLGMALDGSGNLYVADMNNHVVRMVMPDGVVVTVAGDGSYGRREGAGDQAQLGLPSDVIFDGERGLYVTDFGQHVVWHITLPQPQGAP